MPYEKAKSPARKICSPKETSHHQKENFDPNKKYTKDEIKELEADLINLKRGIDKNRNILKCVQCTAGEKFSNLDIFFNAPQANCFRFFKENC